MESIVNISWTNFSLLHKKLNNQLQTDTSLIAVSMAKNRIFYPESLRYWQVPGFFG